jgi:VWFA-related protein
MKPHLLAVSLLLITPLLSAQSPGPADNDQAPDQNTVTLRQEVRNVVIDVVVTDKHGQPVTSLDKSLFKVLENGVPQEIAFFEQHRAGEVAAKKVAQPAVELPADTHTNVASTPADGPLLVLLLDALNTPPSQQSYVRAQILDYLKQIPAGTHMAIFTLGNQLQLIQGFSSDPAILKAALDNKAYPTVTALSTSGMENSNSEGLRLGGVKVQFQSSFAATRSSLNRFANQTGDFNQEMRIRYTLDALNAMGVYLAGIQGRKNLIWFASSVPWTINPDFSLVTSVTGRVDYSQELKNLANILTVGRISVYPVQASGLTSPPGYGADNAGSAFARGGNGGEFGRQEMLDQMNLAGEHMSMENLAQATGGRALYNSNGLSGSVAKIEGIGENYYTLAYSPKDKRYDGGFRELDIKVGATDLKLDYRRGYYADDPAKSTARSLLMHANPLRAVMQRGAPDATQIPFRVQVKQARQQPDPDRSSDRLGNNAAALKGPFVRYDFHWSVDVNGIAFTSTANGLHHAEVDATLAAFDAGGTILNNIYASLPLNLNDAQYARLLKSGLTMKQTLDVPAGIVYLRAAVLDPSNGHTGATEFPLTVQALKPGVALNSPPTPVHP